MKMAKASFACGVFLALVCVGLVLFLACFVKLVILSTKDKENQVESKSVFLINEIAEQKLSIYT